jgi:hypothetical protein
MDDACVRHEDLAEFPCAGALVTFLLNRDKTKPFRTGDWLASLSPSELSGIYTGVMSILEQSLAGHVTANANDTKAIDAHSVLMSAIHAEFNFEKVGLDLRDYLHVLVKLNVLVALELCQQLGWILIDCGPTSLSGEQDGDDSLVQFTLTATGHSAILDKREHSDVLGRLLAGEDVDTRRH